MEIQGLTVNPSGGNAGTTAISVSADPNTSRSQRTGSVTVRTTSGSANATFSVIQSAHAPILTISSTDIDVAKGGGKISITGTSNCSALDFTVPSASWLGFEGGKINGETMTPSEASHFVLTGDPGNTTGEYNWILSFDIEPNDTVSSRSVTIQVEGEEYQQPALQCIITQLAGDATISVNRSSITIPSAGTATSGVSVTSNTNWTVS